MRVRVVNGILGTLVLLGAVVGVRAAWGAIDGNTGWGALPYEGLIEQDGVPVTGARDFCFRLFTTRTSTTPIWAEPFASVPVANGRFSVRLGSGNSFNSAVENAADLFLQVAVAGANAGGTCDTATAGNHALLGGMQQLGAAGFAISAKQAVPNQDFLVSGKLGIGRTPAANLDVVGTSVVSSHASVGGNLDVAGSLRAGGESTVTACGMGAAAGEGTQRYNYSAHVMEYCNGTAWTPLAPVIQGAKAWVKFAGTNPPVIQSAYNVSSVTRAGAGDYTIHFSRPLADTNYAVAGVPLLTLGVRNVSDTVQAYSFATDAVSVQTGIWAGSPVLRDEALVSVVVFGN